MLRFLTAVAILSSGATGALALPACAPPVEIHDLAITRVEQNGVLVATDGRAVKLEGIRLPGGGIDHAPQSFATQALSELGDLASGHLVTAAAQPPKEDRYGRLRAQAFETDGAPVWIQTALLERGLARVFISPDRRECVKELYAAEAEARARHAGIWASPTYAVRRAEDVPYADLGTFQIVEGKVESTAAKSRGYLNFGSDWKTDFTVTVAPDDMKTFRGSGIDLQGYAGKTVRVRGIVEWHNGPEIEIASPDEIEVLPDLRPAQK